MPRPRQVTLDVQAPGARVGNAANRTLFPPTLGDYNRVIYSMSQRMRGHLLLQVLSDMRADGVPPNDDTYRMVIQACSQLSRVQDALIALEQMRSRGLRPDSATYAAVILGAGMAGDFDLALRLLREAQASTGQEPSLDCYMGVFVAYAHKGRWKDSESLLEEMESKGVEVRGRRGGEKGKPHLFANGT